MALNRIEALAQFNKLNKKFIMVLEKPDDVSLLNQEFYLYREIEIDIDQEVVQGDYDSYSIVSEDSLPLQMTEDSLNSLASEKIYETYPLERQLSIVENLLERLADNAGVECEDLKEMNDFINEVRRANGVRKDFFQSNADYTYKTTEEIDAEEAEKYEGGIHEYGTGLNDF